MNAVDLLRVELQKFNNALYSIGTDSLLIRTTALAAPESIDDWSMNLPQMQQQTDPYPAAVPTPATDLALELEQLRYQLAQIMGEAFWYIDPDTTIAALAAGHTFDSAMHTDVAAMAEAEGDLAYWHQVGPDLLWRKLARGTDGQSLRSTATSIAWETPENSVIAWQYPFAGASFSVFWGLNIRMTTLGHYMYWAASIPAGYTEWRYVVQYTFDLAGISLRHYARDDACGAVIVWNREILLDLFYGHTANNTVDCYAHPWWTFTTPNVAHDVSGMIYCNNSGVHAYIRNVRVEFR